MSRCARYLSAIVRAVLGPLDVDVVRCPARGAGRNDFFALLLVGVWWKLLRLFPPPTGVAELGVDTSPCLAVTLRFGVLLTCSRPDNFGTTTEEPAPLCRLCQAWCAAEDADGEKPAMLARLLVPAPA